MITFFDLIQKRRSTRRFLDKPIPKEALSVLLKGVLMSPASKRSNPWSFIVITDKAMLEQLAKCKPHGANMLVDCAAAIVVLADPAKSDVWVEDASIASIYLQLLAEDLGIGSCWVQIRKRDCSEAETAEAYIANLLKIPEMIKVESVVALGYKETESKPFDESKLLKDRLFAGEFGLPLDLGTD